jgi:hypothetical protein
MNKQAPIPDICRYLVSITDNFGIWQHAVGKVPDVAHGYALDDVARGLIVFLQFGLKSQVEVCLTYIEKSLKNGLFVGFFDMYHKAIVYPSSADAHGLAVWALSVASQHPEFGNRALSILSKTSRLPIDTPGLIRPLAYGLIAATCSKDAEIITTYSSKLLSCYQPDTLWFEKELRYANGVLPLAFLNSGIDKYQQVGLKSLAMLNNTMRIGVFPAPPGNRDWHVLGSNLYDNYGQQPIDAAFMVMACVAAYSYSKDEYWAKATGEWMGWFGGNNIWQVKMVDNEGACFDGLDQKGPNENCGAESTIMYLMAQRAYYTHCQVLYSQKNTGV